MANIQMIPTTIESPKISAIQMNSLVSKAFKAKGTPHQVVRLLEVFILAVS
jgi:hypothetical protein